MKRLWGILISLNTVFVLFALTIAFCLIGSLMLPGNLAFFSGIDDAPLFEWLSDSGDLAMLWWIYFLIASVAGLALSTIACTIEALLKRSSLGLLYKFSPQVMHLGVLLVMLGHLLTGAMGHRADLLISEGSSGEIAPGLEVRVVHVGEESNEAGTAIRWLAVLDIYKDGTMLEQRDLVPTRPVYVDGFGLFFDTFNQGGRGETPSAVIQVTRDPGALWALAGGVLVTLGGIGFIYSRRPQG